MSVEKTMLLDSLSVEDRTSNNILIGVSEEVAECFLEYSNLAIGELEQRSKADSGSITIRVAVHKKPRW